VLARSLLALINLDAGLAMPGRAVDLVRAVAAGVLGLAAILVVPWSTRRAPGARRMVAPPGGKRREPSGRGGRKGPGAPAARRGWRPSPLLVLGAGWLLLGVLPVLLVGHRWSTYLTVMMGAGSALLAASVLHRHAWAAALASGYLLLSGPAADAVTGGPFEAGSNSVWSLPRVRRLSEFVGGLRGVLRDHRPRLPRGTAVLLSRMPNMSLVAVHGADAVRAWYADPTLTFAPIESLLTVASHRQVVVLDCDPSVEPNRWSVERPEFVTLRLRAQRALDTEQWLEAARLIEQTRAAPEWRVLSEAWRAGALLTLGQIYQRHNRPTDAEPVYREAVKLDPELTDAWYGLGAVLALRGAYGKSEQALAIAAGRAPDHPLFQFSYGALMLENGRDPALAASHLRRSLELGLEEPSRSVALSLLRQAEAKQAGSAR
jgi:cytochrome c-type biogenesis protein CcmH/NrfG